jgi:hypothetical protein
LTIIGTSTRHRVLPMHVVAQLARVGALALASHLLSSLSLAKLSG